MKQVVYNEHLAAAFYAMRQDNPETYLEQFKECGIKLRLAQRFIGEYEVRHSLWTPAPKTLHQSSSLEKRQQIIEQSRLFEKRAGTMYALYVEEGVTLDTIAKEYGITRERVRSILRHYEGAHHLPNSTLMARKVRRDRKIAKRQEQRQQRQRQRWREPHPWRKLSQEQARYVRASYMVDKTGADLAKELNVNHGIIWMIANNKTYREKP